jgi:drug/metabolite transporter (DMT)-like permease
VRVMLAICSAGTWGASTVFAGRAVRRGTVASVTFWSQIIGLVLGAPVLLLVGSSAATSHVLLSGAVAGVAVAFSLTFLYLSTRFLFVGIASALSAVVGCIGPVAYSSLSHSIAPLCLVGVVVCVLAVVVVVGWERMDSRQGGHSLRPRPTIGFLAALLSGMGFAVYYVALAGNSVDSQVWRAVVCRIVSVIILLAASAIFTRNAIGVSSSEIWAAFPVGLLSLAGSLAYALAITSSSFAIVVPIASLSPVGAVALGWLMLHERVSKLQVAGLFLAMVGVVLVSS